MLRLILLQQPDVWTIVNAIAGSVSALTALVTVLVATRAVKDARRDRQAEDEARRPDFSAWGHIGINEETELHWIRINFQNRGVNPASQIAAKVRILDPESELVEVFDSDIVDTVHAISSFDIFRGDFHLERQGRSHYVVIDLNYLDARTQKKHTQRVYRKWPGLHELVDAPLSEMSQTEVQRTDHALALIPQ